jgi:hypothetical protein
MFVVLLVSQAMGCSDSCIVLDMVRKTDGRENTLLRLGLSVEEARLGRRFDGRYDRRIIAIPLVAGVIVSIGVQAVLPGLGFVHLTGGVVEPQWRYLLVAGAVIVPMNYVARAALNRDRLCYTAHLLFQSISTLESLREPIEFSERIRPRVAAYRSRRSVRRRLREYSWQLAGNVAVLSGYDMDERDRSQTALLGRWIGWVSDDINDAGRIDGAIQACVDTMRHLTGPTPFCPPRLHHPPAKAALRRPPRAERIGRYVNGRQALVIAVVTLASSVVGLTTKLVTL